MDSSLRTPLSVQVSLVALTLLRWGTEAQKRRHLPELCEGRRLGCLGLTEPNAGSDPAAMETRAIKRGDQWVLNGTKTWISNATVADLAPIFAQTDPTKRHPGIAAFLVEAETPGSSQRPIVGKLGLRASNTGELLFEDCAVPETALLGAVGDGFTVAMSALDNDRYSVPRPSHSLIRRAASVGELLVGIEHQAELVLPDILSLFRDLEPGLRSRNLLHANHEVRPASRYKPSYRGPPSDGARQTMFCTPSPSRTSRGSLTTQVRQWRQCATFAFNTPSAAPHPRPPRKHNERRAGTSSSDTVGVSEGLKASRTCLPRKAAGLAHHPCTRLPVAVVFLRADPPLTLTICEPRLLRNESSIPLAA